MPPLKLTQLGEFAYRHGAMTPPTYWKKLLAELKRINEEDGDWAVLLRERIAGMQELLDGKAHRLMHPESYGDPA